MMRVSLGARFTGVMESAHPGPAIRPSALITQPRINLADP